MAKYAWRIKKKFKGLVPAKQLPLFMIFKLETLKGELEAHADLHGYRELKTYQSARDSYDFTQI